MLRELEASQRWPRARLLALQEERRQALLAHALATVPFYERRGRAAGLTPGDLRAPSAWTALPALEKSDLQREGAALRSRAGDRAVPASTSGSAGTPVTVWRSQRSWAHGHANMIRGLRWHGIEPGERHAYFWGVPLDAAGRRRAALRDWLFNRERCSAFALDAAAARAFHTRLARRPVRYALGYPSALTAFADLCADLGLDGRALGWRVAVTTAEVLHEHQRERIAAAFGCPVADSYGCAEAGVAGFACEAGALHTPVESVVVEALPGPAGHEVLLTDLHNRAQPLLRYRVGDLIEPDESPCPCGRTLPRLGRLAGRAGDTLTLPDGRRVNANLPSYVFKHHGREGTVREYQFVQFPEGRIELRIVAGPAWSGATAAALPGEVRAALGVEVAVRVVPRIERRGRGKHRDFVRAEDLGEA